MQIAFIVLLVTTLVVAFEFAAVRWGYDSRDTFWFTRR
jgi:hypothetical protein